MLAASLPTVLNMKTLMRAMTVATKGVPLANAVANVLNVPFVIVRRDLKITEGSTVSVNYVSGSSDRIEKMFLSKRSLPAGSASSLWMIS